MLSVLSVVKWIADFRMKLCPHAHLNHGKAEGLALLTTKVVVLRFFMVSMTLKDIPVPVHQALKLRAKEHGRSLNKEALACLESILLPRKVDTDQLLTEIRRHREGLPGKLSDQLLEEARTSGRP